MVRALGVMVALEEGVREEESPWHGMGKGTVMFLRRACRNLLRDLSAALALNLACFDWTR